MSTLLCKMILIRSLHATWAPNFESAQRELWYYGTSAIAGDY